jgi:hypothetical protein
MILSAAIKCSVIVSFGKKGKKHLLESILSLTGTELQSLSMQIPAFTTVTFTQM